MPQLTLPSKMIKYHFARGNQGPQNPSDFDFYNFKGELDKKNMPQLGIEPRTQGFSVPCSTN